MAVQKSLQKSPLVAGKENRSPQRSKRTISVSTLFEQKNDLKRKSELDARDLLAPKAAGVFKPYASSRSSKKSGQHPIFHKFQNAITGYREGASGASGEQLEPVYNDLIVLVDGLAISGFGRTESATQIHALALEHDRLSNPLGDDKITIQRTRADGSTIAQEHKLADTMQAFGRVLDQKRDELEQLLRELEDVDAEIAVVKQDIIAAEQKEGKKLKRELDTNVMLFVKEAAASRETTLAEVTKARKEDERAREVQKQKFDDFMRTL